MSKNLPLYESEEKTFKLIKTGKMPTPLYLAKCLEETLSSPLHGKAADELRRLHEANAELLEALDGVMYWDNGKPEWETARAAIAKHGSNK